MQMRLGTSVGWCLLLAVFVPSAANAAVAWSGAAYYVKTTYYDKTSGSTYYGLEAGPFAGKPACDGWLSSHYGEIDRLIRSCDYFATDPYKG